MQKHVLSIEDEGITAMNLAQTIENGGYRVTVAFDGREGLEAFYNDPADLVITDLSMPILDGFGVIGILKEQAPETRIAVLSGFCPQIEKDRIRSLGVACIMSKPINARALVKTVDRELAT
ncbi:MAG: response regulator [Candidatus Latescibacterota bacterium]|jgi:DNA-binding response OmpR family regulator|tara:strand:- start:91 stop:453 length:363 start_codon:yes stop_codon:yes gene_type:complete